MTPVSRSSVASCRAALDVVEVGGEQRLQRGDRARGVLLLERDLRDLRVRAVVAGRPSAPAPRRARTRCTASSSSPAFAQRLRRASSAPDSCPGCCVGVAPAARRAHLRQISVLVGQLRAPCAARRTAARASGRSRPAARRSRCSAPTSAPRRCRAPRRRRAAACAARRRRTSSTRCSTSSDAW